MAEYINYINRDDAMKAVCRHDDPREALQELMNLPTLKGEKIVHCMECKHWHESIPEMGQCTLDPSWWTRPNGFCNYAEEK